MRILLAVLGWALFFWSLLAILPTPVYRLWKPGVAATEWGHWLGWLAAGAGLLGFGSDAPAWIVGPAVLAALLFHSPTLRALRRSRGLGSELDRAFDTLPAGSERRIRPAPFMLRDLAHIRLAEIDKRVYVYRQTDGLELRLDLYSPPSRERRGGSSPVVVVIHGGSWSSGDSRQLSGMNRYLAGRGYLVAAINYRLAPRFRFPAQLEDIQGALSFLEAHHRDFGLDPERTVLLGRSSGGHLALCAAYAARSGQISGVAALYAPTDLVWSWQRPSPRRLMDSNGVIEDFLGGDPAAVPDLFALASPIRSVKDGVPPTLLIHGGNDELVSRFQSRRLAAELKRVGARHFHLELPWGKHGLDANLAGPGGQMTLYVLERFLAFATA